MATQLLSPNSHFTSVDLHTTCLISRRQQPFYSIQFNKKPQHHYYFPNNKNRRFSSRSAFDTESNESVDAGTEGVGLAEEDNGRASCYTYDDDKYPKGEFVYKEYDLLESFSVKFKMLVAWPWERVKKGSVLVMKLRGEISDQLSSRFSSRLSLPQICENFVKAAYDPRISGIYLHIEPLSCGWGKVEEIRRHILDFKKSGKFIISYAPVCGEKEYYLGCSCEELYVPPSAYFQLYGLTVQASFLGGVLEKNWDRAAGSENW